MQSACRGGGGVQKGQKFACILCTCPHNLPWDSVESLLLHDSVDKVGLLVVVRTEDDVQGDVLQSIQHLSFILLDARRIQHGPKEGKSNESESNRLAS